MKGERGGGGKKTAHSWCPFVEAYAFACQLGLKSRDELSSLIFDLFLSTLWAFSQESLELTGILSLRNGIRRHQTYPTLPVKLHFQGPFQVFVAIIRLHILIVYLLCGLDNHNGLLCCTLNIYNLIKAQHSSHRPTRSLLPCPLPDIFPGIIHVLHC